MALSRLSSCLSPLPSRIFGQARGPVPTIDGAGRELTTGHQRILALRSSVRGQARGPVPTIDGAGRELTTPTT